MENSGVWGMGHKRALSFELSRQLSQCEVSEVVVER